MQSKRHSGFTLIEVLVAVVVLGIGLTGMAGLQIVSLRNSQQAYQRTQATLFAYDILDRMRANVIAARAGDYDTGLLEDVSALGLCFGIAANCDPGEYADHDRRQWLQTMSDHLSGGRGSVVTDTIADQTQVDVTVQWIDSDAAVDNNGDVARQQLDISFQL